MFKFASFTTLITLTLTLAASATAHAQPSVAPAATIEDKPAERKNSVNANPLGMLFGNYAVNYEHLFDGGHGLLVEGVYRNYDDGDASSNAGGAMVGYRWHWRGRQNSGFLGVSVSHSRGTGHGEINSNSGVKRFNVDTVSTALTANIGKRWAWDSGLNITLRFGAGIADYKITTDSMDPDAQLVVDIVQDLVELFPIALDGELSVGYTF